MLQGYTPEMVFQLSNDFYLSMGLDDMTMCFDTPCTDFSDNPSNVQCVNENPMIVKPEWDVVCHASAWDMWLTDLSDYRYS